MTTSISDRATCVATSELRSRKRLRSAVECAECSIGASSALKACRAGARPNTKPLISASPNANAITRQLTPKSSVSTMGKAGKDPSSSATSHAVSGTDAMAAATNSTIVSVSSCPIRRPRPAPTASLVAISRRRVAARASSMPATLLHAIASSAPVSANKNPMNARNGVRTGPGMRPIGASRTVWFELASGSAFL